MSDQEKELKKQLDEARKEAADLQKQIAAAAAEKKVAEDALLSLQAEIASGKAQPKVTGTYKGHAFDAGHLRVRDGNGVLHDAQILINEAADGEGNAAACAVLDRLIEINYAHFQKVA